MLSADARTFTWVSEASESVLGYEPGQLVGRSPAEYVHPDDLPELVEAIGKSEQSGKVARLRSRWRLPDGSYCWVESAGRPIPSSEGTPAGRVISIHRVDDQVEAESQLAERERQYRRLAENIRDVILLTDAESNVVWASSSADRTLGRSPDELIGQSGTAFIHPDDRESVRRDIESSNQRGEPAYPQFRWLWPDGSYRWMQGSGQPFLDEDTGARMRLVTIRDVDERVRAEEDLSRQESRYRLLAENVSDAILLAAPDGACTWASESAAAVLGWPAEHLVGRTISDFVHADDLAAIGADFERMNSTGGTIRTRVRWRLPDGEYCWVEAAGRPLRDETARPSGHVAAFHRIDEQVNAEQELEASERLYRLLTENTSDVVILVGVDMAIRWISPSVTSLLGWSPEDMIGDLATDYIHGDDVPGLKQVVAEADAVNGDSRYRYRWRCADGGFRWVEGRGRPVTESAGFAGRVVRLRDIDDQISAERELAASEQLYRRLGQNSSDIVLLVDFDFNTLWASPSLQEVSGWRADEFVGRTGLDFMHPDDVARLVPAIRRSQADRTDVKFRIRLRTRDGHYKWLDGLGRSVVPETDPPTRVVRLRDIDDQIAAEHELAASEELYRLLTEYSSDVVLLADTDGRAVWVSPVIKRALGWRPEEIVGHLGADFIHPDDIPAMVEALTSSRENGSEARLNYRMRAKDGGYHWFDATGRMLPATDGGGRRVVRLRNIDSQIAAEHELEASEQRYRLLTDFSSDIVLLVDPKGNVLWAAPAVERALGWRPAEFVGHGLGEFVHPEDVPLMVEARIASETSGLDARLRYRLRDKGDRYHWFDAVRQLLPDTSEGQQQRVIRLRDIDDQVAAEANLAQSERTYKVLAENASDVVWQVDDEGEILWISPSVASVLGWAPEDVVGKVSLDLIHPDDHTAFHELVNAVRRGMPMSGEFRALRADGSSRWMEVSLRTARAEDSAARIGTLRDINDMVQARRTMEFVLQHDQATGLPVRSAMMDRIERQRRQMSDHEQLAVLTVGVDLLKDVNDAFGHHVGDAVIATLAGRIAQAVGDPEALGRGNGDEFIAIIDDASDPGAVAQVAERIRTRAHGEIDILGHRIDPTVSVGIALGGADNEAEALLRESTLAMHHAKTQGRDRWVFADPDLANEAAHRMAVESSVRTGLDADEFVPWYQPIVSLQDSRVAGYEALVRWIHDDQVGLPDDFLPVAERSGLISSIDQLMAERVIEKLAQLPESQFVALNVTGFTLKSVPYATRIKELLQQHAVDGRRLHLEITETRLFRVEPDIVEQMRLLSDIGIRWYVDDFGTGYSSISHLRELPVAGMKLDKSFTEGIREGEEKSRNLADALLGLANGLGLDTVAEGIETPAEAAYLRTPGWRHGQGWLYGRAAPLP